MELDQFLGKLEYHVNSCLKLKSQLSGNNYIKYIIHY